MNCIVSRGCKLGIIGLVFCRVCFYQPVQAYDCPERGESGLPAEIAGFSFGNLWRVETDTGAINHVFGTIHISDPRISQLRQPVAQALNDSASLGMEVVLDRGAISTMSSAMQLADGNSLKKILPPDLFAATAMLLGRYGVSARATEQLKPWAAFVTLSLPAKRFGVPLDMLLMQRAERAGLSIFGLETVAEQIGVFENLSDADALDLLREVVCRYEENQADIETMIELYLAEDLGALMQMSLRYPSSLQDRFLDVLLWQRNRRMVLNMVPYLETGGAFIAIGALHLPGPGGVLDLLSKRGYTIEAIH